MKAQGSVPAGFALGILFLLAIPVGAIAQEASSEGNAAHANQIWGSVRTVDRSTENIFDKNVTILIRMYHENRLGKVVAFGEVKNAHYAVDMARLPRGKYVVQVDTGGSEYGGGERLVDYPGNGSSVNQNWTLYMGQSAIPARE
ncbi:MAG TPA: hypothetical protein VN920_03590 [Pyrinomonadaceae bacterium]|nr:hypothetical protein [Pyrinomonadaceae bacterium]